MHEGELHRFAVGPDGERMTMADLPDPDTKRWVPRIKARIVAAVEGGLMSRDEAMKRYGLSEEEFVAWKAAFSRFGTHGLQVTKISRNRAILSGRDSKLAEPLTEITSKSAAGTAKS